MKILFITAGSGPDTTIGGSLIRTVEIARHVKKRHQIYILTTSGGKTAISKFFLAKQIIEIKTPTSDFSSNSLFLLQLGLSWIKIVFSSFTILNPYPKIDLIYLDSDGIWDLFPAIIYKLKFPSVKIVSMNHHTIILNKTTLLSYFGSLLNIILQKIGRYLIRHYADVIFILDTHAGSLIKKDYLKQRFRGKIFFVRNGIDQKSIRKIKNSGLKKYDACFFGYLRPSKGLYDIIPIWKKVVAMNPSANIAIIGGMLPQYKQYLIEQIKNNSLEKNVSFIGYFKDKMKALEEVKKAKIFISPSHEEGWGIAAMECLALGLPGVVWDLKTYRTILKSGVIKIPTFKISDFSAAINKLLSNDAFYKLFSRHHSYLKEFDWEFIAETDLKLFHKIITT